MKNWLTILSIVWLLSAAGTLIIGHQQFLYNEEANSSLVNPTPMPNIP
jgi:hypothetical protein